MLARFDFRPLPTVLVLLLLALLLWLGTWQLGRADERRAQLASFDAVAEPVAWRGRGTPPARYTRVQMRGRYDGTRQVLLEGLSRNGKPGLEVLTPLRVVDGGVVMINRGWVPWQGERTSPPAPSVPAEEVLVTGRARAFAQPGMRLGEGNAATTSQWPRLAIYPSAQEISGWLGTPVAASLVLLDDAADHGFARAWRPDEFPPSRHVGYAVQWYSMATALIILFLIASRRRAQE
ncbi:MAG: SURF1 family protein [Gammaproteobacteria bacterium]